jgi:hypothetical protein
MIKELIREILAEEIGRDYKTTIDIMMDYRRLPGIQVDVVSIPSSGGFKVSISDQDTDEIKSGFFKDYQEAEFFAKREAMKIYNSKMSKDTSLTVSSGFGPLGKGVEGRG